MNNLVTRLILLVVRMARRLFALFIPATIVVCAPILIVLILIIGACGAELDAEEKEYNLRVLTSATATDAVIAPNAIFVWPVTGQYYITSTYVNPAPYLGLPENVSDGTDVSAIITGD